MRRSESELDQQNLAQTASGTQSRAVILIDSDRQLSEVDDGTGEFTHVHTIDEVLGHYAQGEAHAGALKSGTAQLLTKGTVSLALAGTGQGIDLGVDVGEFTLKPAK